MKSLTEKYLSDYKKKVGDKLREDFEKIKKQEKENNFEYYLESSAVYSCNIEGNTINLNSYMNSKMQENKIKEK